MKATVIVQARMGSSRLPGKVMYKLCDKPILWHVIERLKQCKNVERIIIATTLLKEDDVIEKFSKENNVLCVRGSKDDVLSRYIMASALSESDILVRITSDCPLVSPKIVDKCIEHFISVECDYSGLGCNNGILRGIDTEVFSKNALLKADKLSDLPNNREHVTLCMYNNPDKFRVNRLILDNKYSQPNWRLCVDELDDYKFVKEIYEKLYKKDELIEIDDIIHYLSENPEILKINENVKQKIV